MPISTALVCLQDRLPSEATTRRVQPLQLQEVVASAYCRVWYSTFGFEAEAKLQTRVIFLFIYALIRGALLGFLWNLPPLLLPFDIVER